MAITLAQEKTSAAGSVSVTLSSPTTAGNYLAVCFIPVSHTAAPTGVTLGGSADNFTQIVAAAGAGYPVAIWGDPSCAGGQTSVAVQGYTPGSNDGIVVFEFSGVASLDQSSAASNNTGGTYDSGTTAATASAAEAWVGAVANQAGGVLGLPGSPWTNYQPGSHVAAGYQITTATGTADYSGPNAGGGFWGAAVVTLQGPPPPSLSRIFLGQAVKRAAFY